MCRDFIQLEWKEQQTAYLTKRYNKSLIKSWALNSWKLSTGEGLILAQDERAWRRA